MQARTLLLALLMLCDFARADERPANADRYWLDSWRGWHFYEEPTNEVDPRHEPRPATASAAPAHPARAPELEQLEQLRQRLEDYRNIAVINPSEANVRRYMALEAQITAQASRFADVAQRIAWTTPELDMTLRGRPVNARAIEVFDRDQLEARARTVAALAHDHVLLFFFRSDCPYCQAFAPTLEAFEARYGLRVVAVSLDGGALPAFPVYRRDNGISATLNVTHVPAVFLAQPFAGTITPIGFGVLSESQLLERIATVVADGDGAFAAQHVALP